MKKKAINILSILYKQCNSSAFQLSSDQFASIISVVLDFSVYGNNNNNNNNNNNTY